MRETAQQKEEIILYQLYCLLGQAFNAVLKADGAKLRRLVQTSPCNQCNRGTGRRSPLLT